jgi:hypothetical protein
MTASDALFLAVLMFGVCSFVLTALGALVECFKGRE